MVGALHKVGLTVQAFALAGLIELLAVPAGHDPILRSMDDEYWAPNIADPIDVAEEISWEAVAEVKGDPIYGKHGTLQDDAPHRCDGRQMHRRCRSNGASVRNDLLPRDFQHVSHMAVCGLYICIDGGLSRNAGTPAIACVLVEKEVDVQLLAHVSEVPQDQA